MRERFATVNQILAVNVVCRILDGQFGLAAIFGAAVLLGISSQANAQSSASKSPGLIPPSARAQPVSGSTQPLQLNEIFDMSRAGLDDRVISQTVRERGIAHSLSVQDLVWLRQNGISNELISEMQQSTPKAPTYVANSAPSEVYVQPAPPPPVIIRSAPAYYVRPVPYVHAHPYYGYHYGYHPRYAPPRGVGRVSIGFHF